MDRALDLLAEWLPRQRWFASGTTAPQLRLLAEIDLAGEDGGEEPRRGIRGIRVLIVADDSAGSPAVYQVPIVTRIATGTSEATEDPLGLIGDVPGAVLIDGPRDPAFTAALLRRVAPHALPAPAEVLRGEQSNTSIIYRPSSAPQIICKVFRRLHSGLNPDIQLQTALAGAHSPHVPASVGRLDGTWTDPRDPDRTAHGSLAFAQEFLPGVEDAWRVALGAARAGVDFADEASALGRSTADVHRDLARLFPAPLADDGARAAITETWRRRLEIAVAEVPRIAHHRTAIEARYRLAAATAWPPLQRVHGDYHLGQVLHTPDGEWILVDFEGEPMRPMAERRAPDLALRDVAGMLRSFDYVAGSLAREAADAEPAVTAWAAAARAGFLNGYRSAIGVDPTGPLLDALELEKAVYEAIYEARHRPDWLEIPLRAIDRLVGG